MATYLALYLASIQRTLVLVQHRNAYVLRGVLDKNPFYFQTDILVRLDSNQVEDLRNQTMYGFLPVFRIEADTVAGSLRNVQSVKVAYCATTSDEYDTLVYQPLSMANANLGEEPWTPATEVLYYYLSTAFTRDTVPELVEAKKYWSESLLSIPPLVEAMPVGTVVQLIGAKGNLAMGEVVAINQFGHLIVLTGIAEWHNSVQDYEIRTNKTTRALRRTDLSQVERGYVLRDGKGVMLKYGQPNYSNPMRYGVAVQPAPGHLFALSQLEIEYREGKYYPRANTNFEQVEGQWTPVACQNLANNFAGNIHNSMQQLMNTVGEFTINLSNRSIRVCMDDVLAIECNTLGVLESPNEPLIDHNANGF